MALRNTRPAIFRPIGLSDAIDGTNAFPGAMQSLANLILASSTRGIWVPRPAAASVTSFAGFTTPGPIECLITVGRFAYGMIGTADFAGKSVPFCFDLQLSAFNAISGELSTNLPTTQATTGDWEPPTADIIDSRIIFTHPGFTGANKIGWLDISGFTSTTVTGDTHSNTTLDTLSTNVLTAGWKPGMTISSSAGDIPAGTTIKSIAVGGMSVVLSAAATGSNNGVTLTVSGGTQAAPLWGAGDTNLNNLVKRPVAVKNFNGRAYYAVPGNGAQFSDSGDPTNITNATQAITPKNGLDITAWGGLPVQQSTGGVLQALIGFQGDTEMQQITGDAAISAPNAGALAINSLGVGVGTNAPNTIAQTTLGLMFVAPDGTRYVNFIGQVSDPIGANGQGVCAPFINAINPTRMAASFNQNVYRVSVQNGAATGQPIQEYCYDFALKVWHGPHSFPSALIAANQNAAGVVSGHGFILAASGINGQLWSSAINPTVNDAYVENGAPLSWTFQTCLWPDNQEGAENSIVEMTHGLSIPANIQITVQPLDETGTPLDTVSIFGAASTGSVWGSFVWGAAPWDGFPGSFKQYQIQLHNPIVFKQMSYRMTGNSLLGFAAGNVYPKIERLGYLLQA
ncbi:MAG TPA: hypothetical protein VEU47_19065 [Candidatus Cybelea sp.]|nr:hypothetical protein [Candidatus Cybelea sp.]